MKDEWIIDNLENSETQIGSLNQFNMVGFDALRQFQIIINNKMTVYLYAAPKLSLIIIIIKQQR